MKKWYSHKLLGVAAGTLVLVVLVVMVLFRNRPTIGKAVNALPAL